MNSNYPPGVTGNEPQISGVYPFQEVCNHIYEELARMNREVEDLDVFAQDQEAPDVYSEKLQAVQKSIEDAMGVVLMDICDP